MKKNIVLWLIGALSLAGAVRGATPHVQVKTAAFSLTLGPTNQQVVLEPLRTVSAIGKRQGFTDTTGQITFSNAPAGQYRLLIRGLQDLEIDIPDTSGVIQAIDYVTTAGWVAPTAAIGDAIFRGVPYLWPEAQGDSGTVLTNNGSGNLGWGTVAAGGGSSVTNAVLSAGPTNGSVGAKILTAGHGTSLTIVNDTNLSVAHTLWTNASDRLAPDTNTFFFGKQDGALLLGRNAEAQYGVPSSGESLISVRDSTAGDAAFNYFLWWTRTGSGRETVIDGTTDNNTATVQVVGRSAAMDSGIIAEATTNGVAYIDIFTNTVTKVKLRATGASYFNGDNVTFGIGNNSPQAVLHVVGASTNTFRIDASSANTPGDTGTVVHWIPIIFNGTNGFIPFYQ